MCIIIYNRGGKQLEKDMLETAYANNPHGYGIMWYDGDRVLSLKERDQGFDDLWETLQKFKGITYALHLRWRTRGADSRAQCHPHKVTSKDDGAPEDVFLMHNGTMFEFADDVVKSDTKLFAEKLRKIMYASDHEFNESLRTMKNHVTVGNKLLFMDSHGGVTFVNEDQGSWIDDIWYSNLYSFEDDYRETQADIQEAWAWRRKANKFWKAKQIGKIVDPEGLPYWKDPSPTLVLRGTADSHTPYRTKTPVARTGHYHYAPGVKVQKIPFGVSGKKKPQQQGSKTSKKMNKKAKKQRRKARKAARRLMLSSDGVRVTGENVAIVSVKPIVKPRVKTLLPGRHFDSRGNCTMVTEAGHVIRVR